MLNWSNATYKFTLGIGSLATAGLLSTLWRDALSVWVVLPIALLPMAVFVFVRPDELPARVVRVLHVAASVWYIVTAVGLLVALPFARPLPTGWPAYPVFLAVGAVPCGLVLYRAARSRYQQSEATEHHGAEPGVAWVVRPLARMTLPRRIPYNPRWRVMITCVAFFGACSAVMAYKATHNAVGLVINGIITLGQTGATVFYWIIAALAAGFVLLGMVLTVRRLAFPQMLEVGADALSLPHGPFQRHIARIAYADIQAISEVEMSGQRFLHLTASGLRYTITASLFPDADSYTAVRDFIRMRHTEISTHAVRMTMRCAE